MENTSVPPHVVVFPFPAQGHINPGLQFSQLLASFCKVTFVNTSHNIAKLRAAHLDLGPCIRLQALADDGQHGQGPDFFEHVEQMGGLFESLLLKLLQSGRPRDDGCVGELEENCNGGYGDLAEACGCDGMHVGECSCRGNRRVRGDEDVDWPPPICIVSDVFLGWVQDIADKLNLPRFILYTPSPATLVLMLSLPDMLHRGRLPCHNALDEAHTEPLNLPGLTSTLCLADVPSHLLLPPSAFMFNYFIRHSKRIADAAAILLNAFYEVESSAIDAARDLLGPFPTMWADLLQKHLPHRVIPVGPLLPSHMFHDSRDSKSAMLRAGGAEDDVCLQWLQRQPPSSVVYVSFGSMAELPEEQIHELAWGLEASGKPFLWVVGGQSVGHLPPGFKARMASGSEAGQGVEVATSSCSLDASRTGAAEGIFMEPNVVHHVLDHGQRIEALEKDVRELNLSSSCPGSGVRIEAARGLVVSWAPQLDVLSHPSTGFFLSHCGWNSTLEAICAGVPMLGWPLFAEQKMNCRLLVDELKVAMEFSKEGGALVGKEEVERVVREALEMEKGRIMRRRASEWKGLARKAVSDGGPSHEHVKAFGSLLFALHASSKT